MTTKNKTIPLILNNVRLSYPYLLEYFADKNNNPDPKYTSKFLLDKETHSVDIYLINRYIDRLLEEQNWEKNKTKIACFKDGDLIEPFKSEYSNNFILSGSSFPNKKDKETGKVIEYTKIPVYKADNITLAVKEDNLIYGGSYVNIEGMLSTYNVVNTNGICFYITKVTFVSHGERLVAPSHEIVDVSDILEEVKGGAKLTNNYYNNHQLSNQKTDDIPVFDDYPF